MFPKVENAQIMVMRLDPVFKRDHEACLFGCSAPGHQVKAAWKMAYAEARWLIAKTGGELAGRVELIVENRHAGFSRFQYLKV